MTEPKPDEYWEANQEIYDALAANYKATCEKWKGKPKADWLRELKKRMHLIDFRLRRLGEE